jgi:hypothetical protein
VLAPGRDVHQHAPPVARVGLSVGEVVRDHAIDQPGERRGGEQRELGDLRHRVALSVGEQLERPPLLDAAAPIGEDPAELLGDAVLCLAQHLGELLDGRPGTEVLTLLNHAASGSPYGIRQAFACSRGDR